MTAMRCLTCHLSASCGTASCSKWPPLKQWPRLRRLHNPQPRMLGTTHRCVHRKPGMQATQAQRHGQNPACPARMLVLLEVHGALGASMDVCACMCVLQAMAWQAVQDAAVAIQREQQQQQQYAAVQAAMQYVNAAVQGQQQQQQQYAALPAALPAPQPEPSRKQQGQQQQQQGNDRPAQAQGPGRSKKRKRTGASKQGAGTQATGQITQDPGGPSGPPSQPQGAAAAADAAAEVVGASDGGDGEGAPAAKRPSRSARRKAVKRQLRRAGVLPYIPGRHVMPSVRGSAHACEYTGLRYTL